MYHAACKIEFQPFTVVLTADVFQLFIKLFIKKMRWGGTGVVYELTFPRNLPRTHGAMATRQIPVLKIGSSNLPGFIFFVKSCLLFFFLKTHVSSTVAKPPLPYKPTACGCSATPSRSYVNFFSG